MKILDYRKRPQLHGRFYAPEAVMEVARLKHGEAWEKNPALKYFPAFMDRGRAYKMEFINTKGRFSVRRRELRIAKDRRDAFKAAHKLFADACKVVADALIGGRLTGQLFAGDAPGGNKLDKGDLGLIVGQRRAMLGTGYVRLNGGRSHGFVVLKKDDVTRLLSGDGNSATPAKRGQFSGSELKRLEALATTCRDHFQKNGVFVLTLEILTALDVMKLIKTVALSPGRSNVYISARQYVSAVKSAFAGLLAKGGRPKKGTAINEEGFLELLVGFEPHGDENEPQPQNPKTKTATSESNAG